MSRSHVRRPTEDMAIGRVDRNVRQALAPLAVLKQNLRAARQRRDMAGAAILAGLIARTEVAL